MIAWSPKAVAVAGMALATALAVPAYAQSNPFVPSSPLTKQQAERMMEERMRRLEDRLAAAEKAKPAEQPAAGAPGAPAGAPVPPGPNGSAVPGGMTPPVMPGQPMPGGSPLDGAPQVGPSDPIDSARQNGVRFLGCINGVPKFVRASGERVVFTRKEIRDAVRAGYLPECR